MTTNSSEMRGGTDSSFPNMVDDDDDDDGGGAANPNIRSDDSESEITTICDAESRRDPSLRAPRPRRGCGRGRKSARRRVRNLWNLLRETDAGRSPGGKVASLG